MAMHGPILIAGGGIGGLAAALGLARKGFEVVVLEKAAAFGEIGAGIQLGPNAFHAFDDLGIGKAAQASAVFIDELKLMDATSGEEIARIPLGAAFRERFGNPYAVVHRGDLHGVLLAACRESPRVTLRPAAEVAGYAQDGAGVTARLADGGAVTGRALVGADGLWSRVRRQLVGDGAPRVSGHTTYRSVIPVERMPGELRWNAATLWAGPKCHVVHYPLSGWRLFNLVVTRDNGAGEAAAGRPAGDAEVRDAFAHIHALPRRIIEQGRDWKLWVLCDRDPVERWTEGRVALLGDAAHPMLQYAAQGACMALEDAVCLAHVMAARDGDAERAFADYQARRLLRATHLQLRSRAIGEHIFHPEGAHARLRNAIMRSKSADDWYENLQWLYGGSGLDAAAGF